MIWTTLLVTLFALAAPTYLVTAAPGSQDERRLIAGHEQTVGAAMLLERPHLLPLAEEGFELAEISLPVVSSLGTVKVRTNAYSVPLPAGTRVEARVLPATIEVWHEGRCVAQPERCCRRQQEILDLEHYLDVLERKPGALAGSKPLDQWRTLGRWPASYDRFWEGLMARSGRQAGNKEMIELLQLGPARGQERLRAAIEEALALGCRDAAAVRHLMSTRELERDQPMVLDIGTLVALERPLPQVREYDLLLAGGIR